MPARVGASDRPSDKRSGLQRERAQLLAAQMLAQDEEKALHQLANVLVEEAGRYRAEVAAHNEACAGRDWSQPALAHCAPQKARLDAWQARSLEHVRDYQRRLKANEEAVATTKERLSRVEEQLAATDAGLLSLQRQNAEFRRTHPEGAPGAPTGSGPADEPSVVRTANGVLVGGTGWIYGYYVPPGQKALTTAQRAGLDRQMALAGQSIDPAGYDLIIGVASNHDFFFDLVNRVVGGPFSASDQKLEGRFSARAQPLYASLKGTRTDALDCHSNGAMVCLASLSRGDVTAKKVRLFGPQLTRTALAEWQRLLDRHQIDSLEVNLTRGDPIGPASYAFGEAPWLDAALRLARLLAPGRGPGEVAKLEFWSPGAAEALQASIRRIAPGARVNVLEDPGCRERGVFACHDMGLYRKLAGDQPPRR